ncbi:MAG: hypothetical protein L0I76_31020, partial [Pseudonocardia sp.]|nr:hypothetical protein [Pseudonocardia sp.]
FAPMHGNIVSVTDADAFQVYLRPDATPAEAGKAVLDGARQIRERFWPTEGPDAAVIPLPRRAADGEERADGVG